MIYAVSTGNSSANCVCNDSNFVTGIVENQNLITLFVHGSDRSFFGVIEIADLDNTFLNDTNQSLLSLPGGML